MALIECAVLSAVILATAVAMFVLFRYDPEAIPERLPTERKAAELALSKELGSIGALLSRASTYRSTRAAVATLAAVAFGVLEDATHEVVIVSSLHPALKAMADGFIVSLCGGAMVWMILTAVSRRHMHTQAQQRTVEVVHGEVREALDAIVRASHTASAHDREAVNANVEQIERALLRMHPALSDEITTPVAAEGTHANALHASR